jgi:nucleoporin POM34
VKPKTDQSSFHCYIRAAARYTFYALIAIPVLSIFFAILPLVRREDTLCDIPLTPGQRKLLGLPPTSKPPKPDEVYHTPPRYSRTPSLAGSPAGATPLNNAARAGSYAGSPLSNKGSPLPTVGSGLRNSDGRAASGSPFSARTGNGGSPLGVKAFSPGGLGNGGNRRSSLGSPSPLGALGMGTGAGFFSDVQSPSPTAGKKASVPLNSKWLYEKGRRSSGSGFP